MLDKLIFVRHGESVWNAEHRIQGSMDSPLSRNGRRQAMALRQSLCGTKFNCVYASTRSRAIQTAEIVTGLSSSAIIQTPDLGERCFGHWEGLTPAEVEERFPEEWHLFRTDPTHHWPRGAESLPQVAERVGGFIRRLHQEHPGQTVWAFTHGGAVRIGVMSLLEMPCGDHWRTLRISNTSVTVISFRSGRAFLEQFNNTGHLVRRFSRSGTVQAESEDEA